MNAVLTTTLLTLALAGTGCRFMLDEAEGLAHDLADGATRLQNSNRLEELVVEYEPPDSLEYRVQFRVSTSLQPPHKGTLVVGPDWVGSNMGSHTSYHGRFVHTPRELYIKKRGASTYILLEKHGGRIEVAKIW